MQQVFTHLRLILCHWYPLERGMVLCAEDVLPENNPQQREEVFADFRRGRKKMQEKGRQGERKKTMPTETMLSSLPAF